jgi:hypothetical protein
MASLNQSTRFEEEVILLGTNQLTMSKAQEQNCNSNSTNAYVDPGVYSYRGVQGKGNNQLTPSFCPQVSKALNLCCAFNSGCLRKFLKTSRQKAE